MVDKVKMTIPQSPFAQPQSWLTPRSSHHPIHLYPSGGRQRQHVAEALRDAAATEQLEFASPIHGQQPHRQDQIPRQKLLEKRPLDAG